MNRQVVSTSCSIILILALTFCPSVPAFSQDKPIQLSHSIHFTVGHPFGKLHALWAQEIERRTGGKVKITVHYSETLTSIPAAYEGAVRSQSDIAEFLPAMNRGRFPLTEAVDLPGYTYNGLVTSRVAYDFYNKFKPKELDDTHVLWMHAHLPGAFHTKAKPIRTMEDLKGLRIRCTGLGAKIAKNLGGSPVTMSKNEQYDVMQRGIVDATMGGFDDLIAFKLAEVSKYSTLYPPAGYVTAFITVMNKAKWNSLPPNVQKAFTDVNEQFVERAGQLWNEGQLAAIQKYKTDKDRFFVPAEKEGKRWMAALQPLFDEYKKNMKQKGLPGEEALQYRQQLIDKYSVTYPALKIY